MIVTVLGAAVRTESVTIMTRLLPARR